MIRFCTWHVYMEAPQQGTESCWFFKDKDKNLINDNWKHGLPAWIRIQLPVAMPFTMTMSKIRDVMPISLLYYYYFLWPHQCSGDHWQHKVAKPAGDPSSAMLVPDLISSLTISLISAFKTKQQQKSFNRPVTADKDFLNQRMVMFLFLYLHGHLKQPRHAQANNTKSARLLFKFFCIQCPH